MTKNSGDYKPLRKMSIEERPILTTGDVAKICMVAARTVTRWCSKGIINFYKVPGSKDRRIRFNDLALFVKKHGIETQFVSFESSKILLAGVDKKIDKYAEEWLCEEKKFCPEVKLVIAKSCVSAALEIGRTEPSTVIMDLSIGRSDCIELATLCAAKKKIAIANEDESEELPMFDLVIKKPISALSAWNKICNMIRMEK